MYYPFFSYLDLSLETSNQRKYHCKQWSRSNLPQIFKENKQLNDLLEKLIKPLVWVIPNIESNVSFSIFSFQHGVYHTQTRLHIGISIPRSYYAAKFPTQEFSNFFSTKPRVLLSRESKSFRKQHVFPSFSIY